jgi:ribonuclease HI
MNPRLKAYVSSAAEYTIVVDGGARGNGTEMVQCYGSAFVCTSDGRCKHLAFEDIPSAGTNNEAEYESLIMALDWLAHKIVANGKSPRNYKVEVVMDSALVLNQVFGTWKCDGKKNPSLPVLRGRVIELVSSFGDVSHRKITGPEMKAVLGH